MYREFIENSDGDDSIIINSKHIREEMNIKSFQDLCIFIDIYRYWMIDDCIKKLFYNFIKNNKNIDIHYLKNNFTGLDLDCVKYLENK